jgi:hypothetical protein
MKGLADYAPYDRILATCSIKEIPSAWVEQLNDGGIIVAPIWINGTQLSPAMTKHGDYLVGESAAMGGFMNMRNKTYGELRGSDAIGKGRLRLCSEHEERFPEGEVVVLLRRKVSEMQLPMKDLTADERTDLYRFVAVHEKTSVEIFLDDGVEGLGFTESASGIVDIEGQSACVMTHDGKTLAYGGDSALETVCRLAKEWDELGRPGIGRYRVWAFPKGAAVTRGGADVVIEKATMQIRVEVAV